MREQDHNAYPNSPGERGVCEPALSLVTLGGFEDIESMSCCLNIHAQRFRSIFEFSLFLVSVTLLSSLSDRIHCIHLAPSFVFLVCVSRCCVCQHHLHLVFLSASPFPTSSTKSTETVKPRIILSLTVITQRLRL